MVHPIDNKELKTDKKCADSETPIEFKLGWIPLPRRMQHLFQEKLKTLIDKILHNKIKWIMSVYSAKDQFQNRYIFNN